MAGLFGVLDVAARALLVNQRGVRVVSHNVANVNTPGYSRQRQVLETTPPLERTEGHLGTGVEQVTIERVTDGFLRDQLASEGSAAGATDAQARALSLVEDVLNEQGGDGIGAALSRLYESFSELANATAPGQPTEREAVRAAARSLIDDVHSADARLRAIAASTDEEIARLVPEVNALTERIHGLNGAIVRQELSAPANDLRDQRDELVRQLAGQLEIRTRENPDGALVVTLPNGLPLVEGGRARRLEVAPDPSHPLSPGFRSLSLSDGSVAVDVTAQIGSGALGGLLRARDDLVPAAVRSLDVLAFNLAGSVNAVHAAGTGLDGTVGNFFAAPTAVEDAARDLALDPAIAARSEAIAAGLTTAAGDNRNALALADLREARAPLFLPGDPPGPASGPSRTLLEHVGAVVADVGQQARSFEQASLQHSRIVEGLENRRDAVSGVSIDEEMTQLIQLQAAFQANARVIGVVNALMDDVVNLL